MRRFFFPIAATAAVAASLTLGVLFQLAPGSSIVSALSDFVAPIAALAVGFLTLTLVRRNHLDLGGAIGRGWLLVGASAVCWSIGRLATTWGAGAASTMMLGSVILAAAGLLMLPGSVERWSVTRHSLDGLVIAVSLLFVSWSLALGPMIAAVGGDTSKTFSALFYTMTDIVLVTMAVVAASRLRHQRAVPVLLVLGFVANGVADTAYHYQATVVAGVGPSAAGGGWVLGYLLLGLAVLWQIVNPSVVSGVERELDDSIPSLGRALVPYLAALAAACASVYSETQGHFDRSLFTIAFATVALLLVRQGVTMVDNARLNGALDANVAIRTFELVTERGRLRESAQRFSSLLQHSSDVVTVLDAERMVTFQTDSAQAVLGYEADALLGGSFNELIRDDELVSFDIAMEQADNALGRFIAVDCHVRAHDETWRHVEIRLTNLLGEPSIRGYVLNLRDITERKALEEQLTHQAFHDALTGLPNRALFRDRVAHEMARLKRKSTTLGVIFLDIDGFKEINDSLGHSAGDELLNVVADRLNEAVRPGDTVARIGGDEFAVLLEGISMVSQAETIGLRIIEAFTPAINIRDREIFAHASIGIAIPASGSETVDELLGFADLAMYRAKAHSRGGMELFRPELRSAVVERLDIESSLETALARNQLLLHYQPIVTLASGQPVGVEALIRWIHPERGMIPPLEFIPLAEASGLIVPIGRWVLRTACTEIRRWQLQLNRDVTVSVNLSVRQLRDPNLINDVREALHDSGLPAHCLILEVTESAVMDDINQSIGYLNEVRELGVRIALDDFGTGYSSFAYLRQIPLDEIKIDRSFVQEIGEDRASAALARSIIGLGETLGLEVVAEGIEEDDQLRELIRMGCLSGQGYHFARPSAAEDALQAFSDLFQSDSVAEAQ